MTNDWYAVVLLFATYAVAWLASFAAPPARRPRPQFDPILPKPKRARLRLLRGALASHS
ncbi:MAG TPA: hypothetical protein VER11_22680 [Polyangiaceae bacterium]|nr:hypothetical protein [Polyangiaceae bacterium]